MADELYAAGFRPFNPVYPVNRGGNFDKTMQLLQQGLGQLAALQKEREAKAAAANAINDPAVQQMLGAIMSDRGNGVGIPVNPSMGDLAANSIYGAGAMGPAAGLPPVAGQAQIRPQASPVGPVAQPRAQPMHGLEGYEVVGAPADGGAYEVPGGFAQNVEVQGFAPGGAQPKTSGAAFSGQPSAKMTPETMALIQKFAPYVTQLKVARETGDANLLRTRERGSLDYTKAQATTALGLLNIQQRNLDSMRRENAAKMRSAALRGKGTDDVKTLKEFAGQALVAYNEAMRTYQTLESSFAANAEPGSAMHNTYLHARRQAQEALEIYNERRALYESAVGGKLAKPEASEDISSWSDSSLDSRIAELEAQQ